MDREVDGSGRPAAEAELHEKNADDASSGTYARRLFSSAEEYEPLIALRDSNRPVGRTQRPEYGGDGPRGRAAFEWFYV
jgi:hypothetical protein